ncbi:hypothetical protein C7293_13710 [filamentous cyanobacterium CCT1]|nr:hypothetical protein C7293_13710 [filamentous cyanobacterium CCT1]PSN80403.1 hypothetical protein C8B47_06765 [filamentous cyanobacterium CCP4]
MNPLPPPAKAALSKLVASGRARNRAALDLANAIAADPQRYPELQEQAQAVLHPPLPDDDGPTEG